jgi:acyl dehydratase
MTEKAGWKGRFYEDFEVGDVYRHPLGRTVTQTDNTWFTLLTQNTAPIHFDAHYAAQTEFKKPLVDSTFTVALVTGQSVTDVSQNVFANLGWDEVRLQSGIRRRYHLLAVRGAGETRIQVASQRRHRDRENHGLQS